MHRCSTGTAMYTAECTHIKTTTTAAAATTTKKIVWCNLVGWPLKTGAALPLHHFRHRIYCCSLGAKPSASEDCVWMTSQLCNRPILKNMLCVCVSLWGNIWKDGCWCESKCSAFSWTAFYDCSEGGFLCACVSHIISPRMPSLSWGIKTQTRLKAESSASTWQLYGWLCDWHGRWLLFRRRSAPETTEFGWRTRSRVSKSEF